jgi:TATA-box binding protein (TBP) (component of TFIID and TFIIIB)
MTKTLKSGTVTLLTVGLIACSIVRNAGSSVAAANGSVTSTASMSTPRAAHTATLLPNGKVLITGGMERETVSLAKAELYDPATDSFTNTGNMTTTRSGHKAVLLRTGKVLVFGGINHEDGLLASAELYDPATGTFTLTGSMKEKGGGLATVLANGRVLVASSNAELYDPATGSFTATGKMTTQPSTATLLKSGKVLLTGSGYSAELYDPVTETFTPTSNMTVQREKHAATLLPDGKVLITGGMDRNGPEGRSTSAEIYDPAKGSFTAIANMSMARFKHGSTTVLLPNGKVLIAGGGERAEVFDPATSTFSIASGSLDAAWFFATATLLQSGKVLIVGGYRRGVVCTAGAWIYQS